MDILELCSVIIKYILLNKKLTVSLDNSFISQEHSKFTSIACIETNHVLGLL